MTIREYIRQRLVAFGVTEADFAMLTAGMGIDPDSEYGPDNDKEVHLALLDVLEPMMLAPRRTNISEAGFSVSWDFSGLAQWYRWLCRRYGRTPAEEALDACGVSRITDRSNIF